MANLTSELELFFQQVLPTSNQRDITFLDIVRHQTKENTNSLIWAHFLSIDSGNFLSSIFLEALLEIIEVKKGNGFIKPHFEHHSVFTEYPSFNNEGRIDIVIESQQSESVIIIENKIYHWLHNDLENYWKTFERYKKESKIGVLLTLKSMNSGNPNFINITHLEWVLKIEEKGIPEGVSVRNRVYLEDFISNIKLISNNMVMDNGIRFYLQNAPKIEEALGLKYEAEKFIIHHLNKVSDRLGYSMFGNTMSYRQIWDESNNVRVFYTLFPSEIMLERKLKIVIEIDDSARKYYEDLLKVLNENAFFDDRFRKTNAFWKYTAHVVFIEYSLELANIEKLEEFILEKINQEVDEKRQVIINELVKLGYSDKVNF
jgi:hypothetical protein